MPVDVAFAEVNCRFMGSPLSGTVTVRICTAPCGILKAPRPFTPIPVGAIVSRLFWTLACTSPKTVICPTIGMSTGAETCMPVPAGANWTFPGWVAR